MPDYFAFGGCFRSELEFPDLSPFSRSAPPDWEVGISTSPPIRGGEAQGEREVEPGWVLRLFRVAGGWRLDYQPSGSYAILDGGRRVVWHPGTDRREEVARAVILGPVMALALHEAGLVCLHGSAVAVAGKGVGFLAPKGYGKSTLAVALAAAGGQLMSDDLVAVTRAPTPEITPGVHSARILDDVAGIVLRQFPGARIRAGWKGTVTGLPPERLAWDRVPLAALYLVRPVPGDDPGVDRAPLPAMEAALALVRHTKLFEELIGSRERGTMLGWITEVASRVPVYHVDVPRKLERLPEVASRILSWHGGEPD